ncbi:MAG: hypothetical protein IPO21_13105 [Bacteroidales bacterium]|nr:hypothetical protein [Bacteroidales bacterium]
MRILFYLLPMLLIIASCQNQQKSESNQNKNALIPSEVLVTYEHNMIVTNQTIFKSMEVDTFVNFLVTNTLNGKIAVTSAFDNQSKLSLEEINRQIGTYQDTVFAFDTNTGTDQQIIKNVNFNKKNLQRLVMNERWFFDEETFSMKKEVLKYAPISIFYKDSDTLKTDQIKKLHFWYNFEKTPNKPFENMMLIGSDISYEFNLYNGTTPHWLESLSVNRFVEILINRAVKENKDVYDYFDKTKLNEKKVRENLGESTEEYYVEDENGTVTDTVVSTNNFDPMEITTVIFIEDWYLDTTDMRIYKKVKQIAPVRVFTSSNYKGDEEISKKIPFVLYLQ